MERSDPFSPIGFGGDFLGGYVLAFVSRDGSSGERAAPDESFYPWKPRPAYDPNKVDPFTGTLMEGRSSILMEVPSGAPEKMLSGDAQMMGFAMGEQGQPKMDPFMGTGDATLSNVDLSAQNGPSTGAPSDSVHWLYFTVGDWEWEVRVKDGNAYIIPVRFTGVDEVVVVDKPEPPSVSPVAHVPYSPGASVDPSGNASVDTEQTRNRSSAGDRALDQTNDSNANVQRVIDKGEPIRIPPVDVSQLLRDLNSIFKQHEAARIIAAGVREAADEAEARNREEKALNADLPGPLAGAIPIYGATETARGHVKHGNYGRGLLYTALAISDVFLVKSIAIGGGKLVLRGSGALFGSVAERGGVAAGESAANLEHVVRGGSGGRGIGVLQIDRSRLTASELETTINHVKDADFQAGIADGLRRRAVPDRSVADSAAALGREELSLGRTESAGHLPDVAAGGNPLGPISGLPTYANSSIGGQWGRYAPGFTFDGFSLVDKRTGEFLYISLGLEHPPARILF